MHANDPQGRDTPDDPGGLTYADAGVDIDAGADLVERIKPLATATRRPGADGALGGFGALFDPRAAGYDDPVMVAATDGVGTKLKLAVDADRHDTLGIDLVAMCVNDLVVQGAEPLVFLDYFATGRLAVDRAEAVVTGIAEGCRQANCALIGGETAEMPGLYADGHYDLAGFAVGAVERGQLLDGTAVRDGDLLLGLGSSGPHANGYSLIRRIVADSGADLAAPAPFDSERTLADALLTPTRIYVRPALAAIATGGVHAVCHVTGGGFYENLPRVVNAELACRVTPNWPAPPVFDWLAATGGVARREMFRTFNCGIGMVLAVEPSHADDVRAALEAAGERVHAVGRVVPRGDGPAVAIDGIDS